ncbi:MAG: (2Fe-2S)-binding protein [Candidatus Riflebacteria bacterium]|nr:(2Fe-2S)-binding protein [Candidatus Riflebacteria bacterium]
MAADSTVSVKFNLNGTKVEKTIPAQRTLLEMLRRDFSLIAAKEGCGKGECGACTVLLNGRPINSCIKLAASLTQEDSVETLEGLLEDPVMKKVQESFVSEGAVQCGFCIPGMLISSYSLLKNNKKPNVENIRQSLSGNICRCTGYTKIVDAVKKAGKA